jgi:hypothetical protein
VHDDGETTRQSNPLFARRWSPGDGEGPVLQFELAPVAGQHDIGCLKEKGSHAPIPTFRDAADVVDFARLRRQTRARSIDQAGIVMGRR